MFYSVPKIITLAVLAGSMGVNAHSWIDYLKVRGSPIEGHIRNYIGSDWDTAGHHIQDPTLEQPICSKRQSEKNLEGVYGGKTFHKLTASPADTIDGFWLENGHISQPHPGSDIGQIQYFGTFSEEIPTLKTVLGWPEYRSGENQAGFTLSPKKSFDDSTCYEKNPNLATPPGRVQGQDCTQSFVIPADIGTDKTLTVFWVWDFSGKNGNAHAHTEWYTSCLDIALTAKGQSRENHETTEDIPEMKRGLLTRSAKFAAALGAQA